MNAVETIKNLYKNRGFNSFFVNIRFWDAPLIETEKFVPKKGLIIDLGCGEGIFTNYLAVTSPRRRLIGIEINKDRLRNADHKISNTKFQIGDIVERELPLADAIVLMHVFHHMRSYHDQEILLKKCYKKLKTSGRLIVVEVDNKPFLKYLIAKLADLFVVPILFEKRLYNEIFYRTKEQWLALLKKNGFNVKYRYLDKNKPFSHILFIARKDR